MNRKQQKILNSIFAEPTLASIKFADIEKLLVALNNQKLFVHRLHPAKEAKKYQVEVFREFLELAGIKDE